MLSQHKIENQSHYFNISVVLQKHSPPTFILAIGLQTYTCADQSSIDTPTANPPLFSPSKTKSTANALSSLSSEELKS